VPAGKSYSGIEEEESEDHSQVSEDDSHKESEDKNKEYEEELPDISRPKLGPCVVAVYEGQWVLTELSTSQADVAHGYTRLSFMVIKGSNAFAGGPKRDILVTLNTLSLIMLR
jgi:hypothetical protein